MADVKHCPECGCELPADAPAGHCPDCLLKLGLPTQRGTAAIGATIDMQSSPSGSTFEPPKPGELAAMFPQFEILDVIGVGGMGAVYKAQQKSLDRLVALKIIKSDMASDPGFAERFSREAKALARLNHPHIVAVHDFGETDGLFYFVMEYVDGVNLRRLIESEQLAAEQALKIIPQVCEALQFAHDEGIVHRDIKPENILIDSRGRVKIADFGLAKLLDTASREPALTATHQVMGTPRYMAPEQMEGSQSVDHRADIYSLGVVFYELLTGELPLGRFDAPSQKAPIDGRLDDVVMRALEKDLPRRYQQASELKSEVERISEPAAEPPGLRTAARKVPPKSAENSTATRAMKQHVTILAVIHIALSSVFLIAALIVFVAVTGGGVISNDTDAMWITAVIGTSVGGFLAILALPGIIAGFALLSFKQWARILILILAVLNLANIPFGTALSVYAFWVLLHKDTVPLFSAAR